MELSPAHCYDCPLVLSTAVPWLVAAVVAIVAAQVLRRRASSGRFLAADVTGLLLLFVLALAVVRVGIDWRWLRRDFTFAYSPAANLVVVGALTIAIVLASRPFWRRK